MTEKLYTQQAVAAHSSILGLMNGEQIKVYKYKLYITDEGVTYWVKTSNEPELVTAALHLHLFYNQRAYSYNVEGLFKLETQNKLDFLDNLTDGTDAYLYANLELGVAFTGRDFFAKFSAGYTYSGVVIRDIFRPYFLDDVPSTLPIMLQNSSFLLRSSSEYFGVPVYLGGMVPFHASNGKYIAYGVLNTQPVGAIQNYDKVAPGLYRTDSLDRSVFYLVNFNAKEVQQFEYKLQFAHESRPFGIFNRVTANVIPKETNNLGIIGIVYVIENVLVSYSSLYTDDLGENLMKGLGLRYTFMPENNPEHKKTLLTDADGKILTSNPRKYEYDMSIPADFVEVGYE